VRFLIISDIHGNLEALQAVLADSAGQYDQVLCCGDLVGYNPNPAEVLEWAQTNCRIVIRGNHDKAVAGLEGLEWFNEIAQASALWSRDQLTTEQIEWLRNLPEGPIEVESCTLFHGAPFDEDYYVLAPPDARECFGHLETEVSFFGHTHVQGGFYLRRRQVGQIAGVSPNQNESTLQLEPDSKFIINPGSAGQPRDTDPRAAYALYEPSLRTVTLRRVEYQIQTTSNKLRDAGLPEALGLRLFHGM
jgi:predicted phosphodiesterase